MDILASVIVVIYNSAKFVLETLESIKKQTYPNIELIVTDDGSKDNTCEIVNDWLEENSFRFARTQLIKNNSGQNSISANCNRGLNAARGKYVKFIAGDDILLPNCIEDNLVFAEKEKAAFVFSKCEIFTNASKYHDNLKNIFMYQDKRKCLFELNADQQYKNLLKKNFTIAPAAFINRDILKKLGGFDERFFIEDYPLWLKATQNGFKLYFFDKFTVRYRLSDQSCSNSINSTNNFFNKRLVHDLHEIYLKERRNKLPVLTRWDEDIRFYVLLKTIEKGNNKHIYDKLKYLKLFSPYFVVQKILGQ